MSKNNRSFEAQLAQNFHVAEESFLKLKTKRRNKWDKEMNTKSNWDIKSALSRASFLHTWLKHISGPNCPHINWSVCVCVSVFVCVCVWVCLSIITLFFYLKAWVANVFLRTTTLLRNERMVGEISLKLTQRTKIRRIDSSYFVRT